MNQSLSFSLKTNSLNSRKKIFSSQIKGQLQNIKIDIHGFLSYILINFWTHDIYRIEKLIMS